MRIRKENDTKTHTARRALGEDFGDWTQSFREEIKTAMETKNIDMEDGIRREYPLLAIYHQEKLSEQNRRLVWATRMMAVAT